MDAGTSPCVNTGPGGRRFPCLTAVPYDRPRTRAIARGAVPARRHLARDHDTLDVEMSLPVHQHPAAGVLLTLADARLRGEGEEAFLSRLARDAARVPGVDAAGCHLTGTDSRPRSQGASNEAAGQLERVQLELREGPCIETARSSTPLTNVPMLHAHSRTRWPRFTRRVLDAGFTAVTALPLRSHDRLLGTLNLYHQLGALHRDDVRWCQLLAAAAALGLAHHDLLQEARRRGEQLQGALDSRVVIEQAKGILAERLDCPVQDAFALLRRHARSNRMKLTDLSAQIIGGPADAGPFPRPSVVADRGSRVGLPRLPHWQ